MLQLNSLRNRLLEPFAYDLTPSDFNKLKEDFIVGLKSHDLSSPRMQYAYPPILIGEISELHEAYTRFDLSNRNSTVLLCEYQFEVADVFCNAFAYFLFGPNLPSYLREIIHYVFTNLIPPITYEEMITIVKNKFNYYPERYAYRITLDTISPLLYSHFLTSFTPPPYTHDVKGRFENPDFDLPYYQYDEPKHKVFDITLPFNHIK